MAASEDSNPYSEELYDSEALNERINENLELPDIQENTIIYNGTVDPDFILRVETAWKR
ncbi:hypothetical protein [Oceanobacillus sojae]|uniref:hypothetical protein n=1 Tax=Oceanobacillus sojae TaxID=582851 RepID=UPI00158C4A18|nr:hypothetical protein [Oceanobacillus sojae]